MKQEKEHEQMHSPSSPDFFFSSLLLSCVVGFLLCLGGFCTGLCFLSLSALRFFPSVLPPSPPPPRSLLVCACRCRRSSSLSLFRSPCWWWFLLGSLFSLEWRISLRGGGGGGLGSGSGSGSGLSYSSDW